MPVTTLKALNNQQNFLRILIFSVVTVIIWIGFSIFRSQQQPQIPEEQQKMAIPLNPTIDMEVISRIEQKKTYSPEELNSFPIFGLTTDRAGSEGISILNGQAAPASTQTEPATESPVATPTTQNQSSTVTPEPLSDPANPAPTTP